MKDEQKEIKNYITLDKFSQEILKNYTKKQSRAMYFTNWKKLIDKFAKKIKKSNH